LDIPKVVGPCFLIVFSYASRGDVKAVIEQMAL
jgi:hypothetical protein